MNMKQNIETYKFLNNAYVQLNNNVLTGIIISELDI